MGVPQLRNMYTAFMLSPLLFLSILPVTASASLFTCNLPASGASFQVDAFGSYAFRHPRLSLQNGRVAVLVNGTFLDSVSGSLALAASQTGSSTDAHLGPFSWLNITWAPSPPSPFLATLVTQFRCYATFLAFEAQLPSGATNTCTTWMPNSQRGEFSANAFPSVQFPSFPLEGDLQQAGFFEWAGRFSGDTDAVGVGLRGFTGGMTGGPLVLYDPTFSPNSAFYARPDALLLAPLSSFKASILGLQQGPPVNGSGAPLQWLSGGPQGKPASLPPSFSYSFALVPSGGGVNAATLAYGAILRAGRPVRMASSPAALASALEDVGTSFLSYWLVLTLRP